jgi:hypothetical protein
MATKRSKPPWDRKAPAKARKAAGGGSTGSLTPSQKAAAKQRAKKAGRPYPNLVDNMRAASTSAGKTRTAAKKPAAKKPAAKKTPSKKSPARKSPAKKRPTRKTATKTPATKTPAAKKSAAKKSASAKRPVGERHRDPRGGLTAAGRAAFRREQGSTLRPGVRKRISEMTPTEMRRKGSWAVRFYGREELPPLLNRNGEPTRFALSAHAWGEPVPKTEAAARRIADKGRRLLARYERLRGRGTGGTKPRRRSD